MKKFSKITEKAEFDESKMRRHPAVNPEDWSKFQDLKAAIAKSDAYGQSTAKALQTLIERMNVESMIYWQRNEKSEGGFDDFFRLFDIRTDEDEIKDCIRDIIDKSEEIYEDSDDSRGEFFLKMTGFRYASADDLIEDVKDAHRKLCMIDGISFRITFQMRSRDLVLPKKLYGGREPNIDAWFDMNGFAAKDQIKQIIDIRICVWNPETNLDVNPF